MSQPECTQNLLPPPASPWQRLQRHKAAMAGLYFLGALFLICLFFPMLSSLSYADQNLWEANAGPSAAHWFGTDNLGRDLATRVCYGARISLAIGIVASLINLGIGVLYGGISGYFGGRIDIGRRRIRTAAGGRGPRNQCTGTGSPDPVQTTDSRHFARHHVAGDAQSQP